MRKGGGHKQEHRHKPDEQMIREVVIRTNPVSHTNWQGYVKCENFIFQYDYLTKHLVKLGS